MPRYVPSPALHDAAPATGVLLVNSGTPDSLDTGRRAQFPAPACCVTAAPSRCRARCGADPLLHHPAAAADARAAKYRRVWTAQGSPLLQISLELQKNLREHRSVSAARRRGGARHALFHRRTCARGSRRCAKRARSASSCCRCTRSIPPPPTPRPTTRWVDALRDWRFVPELHIVLDYADEPALPRCRWPPVCANTAAQRPGRPPADHLPWHSEAVRRARVTRTRASARRRHARWRSGSDSPMPTGRCLPVARGPRGMAEALHRRRRARRSRGAA